MRIVLAFVLCVITAACTPKAQPVDIRTVLTRPQLDAVDTPVLLVEIATLDAQATLLPWMTNRDVVTWRAADGASIAIRDGLVIATRGLNGDMMTADLSATRLALSGGSRQGYSTFRSYLDAENQTVFRTAICDLTVAGREDINSIGLRRVTTRYDETCRTSSEAFTNTYWIGADGTIWKSRQWMGTLLGSLVVEQLKR